MDISIVRFHSKNQFSITCELGDILDISYFAQQINMDKSYLLRLLDNNNLPYFVDGEVLCFNTEKEAAAAIQLICKGYIQKVS